MMKHLLFSIATMFALCIPGYSQDRPSDELTARILEQGKRIQSVECDFTQTKSSELLAKDVVSTGHMSFKKPGCLEWRYITPFKFAVFVEGKEISIEKEGQRETLDAKTNSFVKEISGMILNTIECNYLDSKSAFKCEASETGTEIIMNLYPQGKDLKRMYTLLTLGYDKKTLNANRIELHEASGDVTVIKFKNCKYGFSE